MLWFVCDIIIIIMILSWLPVLPSLYVAAENFRGYLPIQVLVSFKVRPYTHQELFSLATVVCMGFPGRQCNGLLAPLPTAASVVARRYLQPLPKDCLEERN